MTTLLWTVHSGLTEFLSERVFPTSVVVVKWGKCGSEFDQGNSFYVISGDGEGEVRKEVQACKRHLVRGKRERSEKTVNSAKLGQNTTG